MDGDQAFRDEHKVSPTQIETFDLCNRKWALRKLDKIPSPPNKYAQRGTDTHLTLEGYQQGKGIDFDTEMGKIVAPGLSVLPRPGTHEIEKEFLFRTQHATYHGKKDLRSVVGPILDIWDYKTTVDLKWMKVPAKLRRDYQAVIYSVSEIEEAKEKNRPWERVELNWMYFRATPDQPRARRVQLHVLANDSVREPVRPKDVHKDHFGIVPLSELMERFGELEEKSVAMLNYHRLYISGEIKGGLDVPYDVEGCDAFGGCPYKNKQCKLTVSEKFRSMEAKVNLKTKMQQAKEKAAAGSGGKPSAEAQEAAAGIKAGAAAAASAAPTKRPPDTNPPEHANGVDPDSPKVQVQGRANAGDRMQLAGMMAQGLISSREFSMDDGRSPTKVAKLAVDIADALLVELAKPVK